MKQFLYLLITLILSLSSCGLGNIGYGVVLWTDSQSKYRTGEIINIISKSDSQKTYVIRIKDGESKVEIPYGRVAFYNNRKDAANYIDEYTESMSFYAYSD